MDILIVGAGVVGFNLAQQLALEQHDIAVIESTEDRARDLEAIDCRVTVGDGTSPSVLLRAGISNAELVIAVTDNDAANIIICMLAEQFGVRSKVARVRNREYTLTPAKGSGDTNIVQASDLAFGQALFDRWKIDYLINPDLVIVEQVLSFIDSPNALEVADFAGRQIQLRKYAVPEGAPLAGRTMVEIAEFTAIEPFLVVAIQRDGTTIVPSGTDKILAGDHVVLVMPEGIQPFVLPLVGVALEETTKVVLTHSSPATLDLARRLETEIDQVILIEPDGNRANAVARDLGKTQVLHGSPTDVSVLRDDVGVDTADFFLAMGDNDGHNLLAALLAKRYGAKHTGMLVQEAEYHGALENLGLDLVVNARLLTMAQIIRYVRRGHILSVAKFSDENAEAIEFIVDDDNARIAGKPLKKAGVPKGAIIGAVQRGDEYFVPTGETVIEAGDKVIVFALRHAIGKVEKLFSRRGFFG